MNKKLLFGFMSLAALAACTNDDFESQNGVAEEKSPIQFEVINNNEVTRAQMNGNTIKWSAADGDLFTLYHGAKDDGTGYQNATYKAEMGDGGSAVLTTPSMIKEGYAIMTWPVDTAFSQTGDKLQVRVPAEQTNIVNNIPYVSDVINIGGYAKYSETADPGVVPTAYNTAGYARKYPIYMRPMASQLTIKADYAGTDAAFKELATGDDPINPIGVTSIELGNTVKDAKVYTTGINLTFEAASDAKKKSWKAAEPNNAWSHMVGFDTKAAATAQTLTASKECLLEGNQGCKFLILPQSKGDGNSQVVVNTIYGKVVIGDGSSYEGDEAKAVWYRYISEAGKADAEKEGAPVAVTSGEFAGKFKASAKTIGDGMNQTFTSFDTYTAPESDKYVGGEKMGVAAIRYVKVLLNHIDMDKLHVTSDKQLYDAVRVWKEIGAKGKNITVYLDGKDGNFEISQKTIAKINEINAATAAEKRSFNVMPCKEHKCETIVITGGDEIPADLTFIKKDTENDYTVPVALNAGEKWKWNSKNVTVAPTTGEAPTGISKIINKGTLVSDANATLQIFDNSSKDPKKPNQINTIGFENDGKWDITAGAINVQFNVTNNGTVNIAKGAEYRQDMADEVVTAFTNDAQTVPERFYKNDPKTKDKDKFVEKIGVVNNSGVFAALAGRGQINNYGLIEHLEKNAKTYITTNEKGTTPVFANAFNDVATSGKGSDNKMGRINLPFSNKDEDNISIDAAANQGFVSVTVTSDNAPADKKLDASKVGTYVNYVIINSGIEEVTNVSDQVKYIEFNDKDKNEIAWLPRYTDKGVACDPDYVYEGLVVFSPVNIKLNTTVQVKSSAFLAANIYVAGKLNNGTEGTQPNWDGYFGKTADNAATKYITFK